MRLGNIGLSIDGVYGVERLNFLSLCIAGHSIGAGAGLVGSGWERETGSRG